MKIDATDRAILAALQGDGRMTNVELAERVHLSESACLRRVRLLEEHHRPYTWYLEAGLHFAVTRVEVDYHRAARFDDRLTVTGWLTRVRGASLAVGYTVARGDELLATASTEHACVDDGGRPRRIPRAEREALAALVAPG